MYVLTLVRDGPYRFYLYNQEANEQPHIHVDRHTDSAKFWLNPVALAANYGFGAVELGQVEALVERNATVLLEAWGERFGTPSEERAGRTRAREPDHGGPA